MELLVEAFLNYMVLERNRSGLTADAYGRDLRQFADYAGRNFPDIDPADIAPRHIRKWLAEESARGLDPRSLRRKTQSLRSFFNWMVLTGRRAGNPAAALQLAKPSRPLPAFVVQDDMEKISARPLSTDPVLNRRDHLIVELLYTCGLRQAELLSLRDCDISFERAEMRVHGKGGKTRIVPLAEESLDLIAEWRRYRDYRKEEKGLDAGMTPLFPGRNGEPLSRARLYQIVRDALLATSAHRRSPHTLRHSFATAMLNGGADIMTVKEFLGHSSLSSTQIYTHLNFRELQRDYAVAHPRGASDFDHSSSPVEGNDTEGDTPESGK